MCPTDTARSREMTHAAMKAELLDAETERELAIRWRDDRDSAALHRLTIAYMRLAVSLAGKFRRYGAPMSDLIQEANMGLMKAAMRFDPDRGVRFSTYSTYWIKAQIQDYVMRNWSLVRTGSTSSQKSLFFNLHRVRAQIERRENGALTPTEIQREIAEELGVPMRDVQMMDGRMAGSDFSLNVRQVGDEGREWQETLEDTAAGPEEVVQHRHDTKRARRWIADAFSALTHREREIIAARKLGDKPTTLAMLGEKFGLSKERVRQLEAQALKKLRARLVMEHGSAAEELATVSVP